jgi:hypothetical protein
VRPDEFEKLARSPEPAWVAYWRVALSLPGALALLSFLLPVLLSADAMFAVASNINVPSSPDAHKRATNRIVERLLVALDTVAPEAVALETVALETVAGDTAVERLIASAVKR